MATSGTAAFNLDFVELIEESYERCGQEVRNGYDVRTARRSLNLLFADWANRGLNLWTLDQGVIPLYSGVAEYALPTDTVDLIDHVIRTGASVQQTDLTITRISQSNYSAIPNKLSTGRPIQLYVKRTESPSVVVWPLPSNDSYTLVYWRLRRIQDAGNGANTLDVPFRFIPCMVAGLAYYLSVKIPDAADRVQMLKMQYDEAWQLAADEDRDRAPVRFVPRIGAIR